MRTRSGPTRSGHASLHQRSLRVEGRGHRIRRGREGGLHRIADRL